MVIGGMPVGVDSRVHTTFGHNPSTLRLCSFDPNLQNIPRADTELGRLVRGMFRAPTGRTFLELDFSGIEAVLTGYFVGSRRYTWLAQRDIHSFITAAKVGDPADMDWPEDRLLKHLKAIKKAYGSTVRQSIKPVVHGSNYLESPAGMVAHDPELFKSVREAKELQQLYFGLFPEIQEWHHRLCDEVDGQLRREGDQTGIAYVRNPFGYVHHFFHVLDWEKVILPDGSTQWFKSFGDDAKRLIAFLPQSTAAAIIKAVAKRIFFEFPWVGQWMRLLIHDSILFECPNEEAEQCLKIATDVMEAPIPELPLDPAWEMGSHLVIRTEAKMGSNWSEMKSV